jgi:hypothetical protein
MALIKLRKANEAGEDVGVVIINTDQIVAVSVGEAATELQMSDGRTRWVKESPDEVVSLAKKSDG